MSCITAVPTAVLSLMAKPDTFEEKDLCADAQGTTTLSLEDLPEMQ